MPECDSCSDRLSLRTIWRNLRGLNGRTYPFLAVSGRRVETPVRWLCDRCARNARRLRQSQEQNPP